MTEVRNPAASVSDVSVTFRSHRRDGGVTALRGVSLAVLPQETLGVVGESGSGKSTLARVFVGLTRPNNGIVLLNGRDLWPNRRRRRSPIRGAQMVFQDPSSSLNPRLRVGLSVAEPLLRRPVQERQNDIAEILDLVGIPSAWLERYPHELSGGQQQRLALARALIANPVLIAFDEPTSALDVSLQSQVLQLITRTQEQTGFAAIFVSHDLAAVEAISHRIAVMYLGAVVELGSHDQIVANPLHPYTVKLRDSVPVPDPIVARARDAVPLGGEAPDPKAPPSGCPFRTRCPAADDLCASLYPAFQEVEEGHFVACHFPGSIRPFGESVSQESM